MALPAFSASKTVRDWTGNCDGTACFAEVTGAGGLAMGGQGYRLQIHRANNESAAWYLKLVARKVPGPAGPATVTIDEGEPIPTTLAADSTGEGFDFADQASLEELFPMLRNGNGAVVGFGDQSEMFSLSGIAAVLLWIDERQGRVGNSDQVAAISPDANIDAAEVKGDAAIALRNTILATSPAADCQWAGPEGDTESFYAESYRLDDDHELFLVRCMMGAYQPSMQVFLKSFDRFELMAFPDYSDDAGWGGTNFLGYAEFNAKTLELHNYVKFRGIGDCGTTSAYRWTGYAFKLLEYRYRDCSDDEPIDPDGELPEFPVIYKSK
jgi:hypothetical protein